MFVCLCCAPRWVAALKLLVGFVDLERAVSELVPASERENPDGRTFQYWNTVIGARAGGWLR